MEGKHNILITLQTMPRNVKFMVKMQRILNGSAIIPSVRELVSSFTIWLLYPQPFVMNYRYTLIVKIAFLSMPIHMYENTHTHRSNKFQLSSEKLKIMIDRWQKYENQRALVLCSFRYALTLKQFSSKYCRVIRRARSVTASRMNDQDVIRGKLGCLGRFSSRLHIIIIWDLKTAIMFIILKGCQYYYQQNNAMGNQGSAQGRGPVERRSRYRSIDNAPSIYKSKVTSSRKNDESFQDNSIFVTPPINKSYSSKRQLQQQSENQQDDQEDVQDKSMRNYQSIDVNEGRRIINSDGSKKRSEKDRNLQELSRKNQAMRKQLKVISAKLTEILKRKKLVPKRKDGKHDDDESEVDNKQAEKQQMGLKRQLENAYKQIEMYKKLLTDLKSKQEGITADHKVSVLQNEISIKNEEIQKYQLKKQALQKIRNKQNTHIKQDINDDLQQGVEIYKKQIEQLKRKLKKYAQYDRVHQIEYKKQNAYYCDLKKRQSEIYQTYFPELSNKLKKEPPKKVIIDKDINEREFRQLAEEARLLRLKHEEYNRKIEQFLQAKNKRIQEQNDLKQLVLYKQKIIETLKAKIANVNKLLKPRKKNLFGYDSQQQGSEVQSQYNDNQSQIERQLEEELNQDQFDIKHLIANIPKPVRKRPQEITNGYSSGGDSSGEGGGSGQQRKRMGGGMVVTSEKAEPKRWGATITRTQQRGKHFKGELAFEDKGQFESDVQPLIVGVNVWVNKNNTILGIQAIYLNNNELRYGAKSSESADGIIRRFDLQTPDYLKNLTFTITRDGFVESMTLYSKQGKIGKFGNKRADDQNVNFGLASNERPYMFFGASSLFEAQPRLNSFGIQICSE